MEIQPSCGIRLDAIHAGEDNEDSNGVTLSKLSNGTHDIKF